MPHCNPPPLHLPIILLVVLLLLPRNLNDERPLPRRPPRQHAALAQAHVLDRLCAVDDVPALCHVDGGGVEHGADDDIGRARRQLGHRQVGRVLAQEREDVLFDGGDRGGWRRVDECRREVGFDEERERGGRVGLVRDGLALKFGGRRGGVEETMVVVSECVCD